jgi:hypothetical protein
MLKEIEISKLIEIPLNTFFGTLIGFLVAVLYAMTTVWIGWIPPFIGGAGIGISWSNPVFWVYMLGIIITSFGSAFWGGLFVGRMSIGILTETLKKIR